MKHHDNTMFPPDSTNSKTPPDNGLESARPSDNQNLQAALDFLKAMLEYRLGLAFAADDPDKRIQQPPYPAFREDDAPFTFFLQRHQPNDYELLSLVLALTPHLLPGFFDQIIARFLPQGGDFPEFGGAKTGNHRGMTPTGETLVFLLAGANLESRLKAIRWMRENRFFNSQPILSLENVRPGEPALSGRLLIDAEWLEWLSTGRVSMPRFSTDFPAQYIHTEREWDDLVLPRQTIAQLQELENWLRHNDTLLQDWGLQHVVKPGYRVLFYGPPGGGKTMTASLLGKYSQRPVFKVDLSMVVSKYIGETEKNLAALFDKAEHKNWILFFDEADALFGKRTNVRDAHDKYANQEVSFLLQRIEDFPGLIILASNFKSNMDEAFVRRFQSVIHFPMPRPEERLTLWQKSIPHGAKLDETVDLKFIAEKYELSGSNIINIVHYCCLQALAAGSNHLGQDNLLQGIQRELIKENKVF